MFACLYTLVSWLTCFMQQSGSRILYMFTNIDNHSDLWSYDLRIMKWSLLFPLLISNSGSQTANICHKWYLRAGMRKSGVVGCENNWDNTMGCGVSRKPTYPPTYPLHGAESLRSHFFFSWSRYSPHFVELQCTVPCFQDSAICCFPEPDQSNMYTLPHSTSWRSILVLSSHLHLGLPVVFPQVSPSEPCMHLSCPPYMLHSRSISFSIWSLE